jgi:hypothetical protein
MPQIILQAHQYFLFCPAIEHVRLPQRYVVAFSHGAPRTPANSCAVSDVFHTGSPDSPLWEFKHGNGNFKRGDLVGLREIKRRASRHALIHRDSFSATPKVPTGPPAGQPVEPMPDPVESRLNVLEHNLYDMHARMQRSEESCAYLNQKTLVLMEGMVRCHQVCTDVETGSTLANVPISGIRSSQIILWSWCPTRITPYTRMVSTTA